MESRYVDVERVRLHTLDWAGDGPPFLLLHGLSSNARTWELVGEHLAAAGHRVIAVDQRGHGLSDKPSGEYDFGSVTTDLARLIAALSLDAPIIAGQSWGGNVVLEFAARYPGVARGLAFVDGGFLDLQGDGKRPWEDISTRLRPPELDGTPWSEMAEMLRTHRPEWPARGIEATMANFERLPDGTLRRRLSVPYHMRILRALWEQRPAQLYPLVQEPVLIAVAEQAGAPDPMGRDDQLAAAIRGLKRVEVHRFENTDHDIHVHRPHRLAQLFIDSLNNRFWE